MIKLHFKASADEMSHLVIGSSLRFVSMDRVIPAFQIALMGLYISSETARLLFIY